MTAGPAARAGGDEVATKIANQAEITGLRRRTGQVNRQVGTRAKIYLAHRLAEDDIAVLTGEAPAT